MPKPYTIEDNVPIPLSDGVILSAKTWRPNHGDSFPVVLEHHPYAKRYATARRDENAHGYFARQGYFCIRVDMRGSGESSGVKVDEYTDQERIDTCEVIDWIASQPWCNGNIGMYGLSWGGFISLQLAAISPSALKAVAVAGATDDRFMEDAHRMGGVMTSDNMGWSVAFLSFMSRPPDPSLLGRSWKSMWKKRLSSIAWPIHSWLSNECRNRYWIKGFPAESRHGLQIPALIGAGTADVFATSALRMAYRQADLTKVVIGPWSHNYPHMANPGPAIDWLKHCTKWFDRWLRSNENDVEREPGIRAFIQDVAKPSPISAASRSGHWFGFSVSAASGTDDINLPLGQDGSLGGKKSKRKVKIKSPLSLGLDGGEIMPMGWGADLADDQWADDARAVCFETEPLRASVSLFGNPKLKLRISSSVPTAQCVVRLNAVSPEGESTRIAIGARNLNLSDDFARKTKLTLNKFYEFDIDLSVVAHRIDRRYFLRLAISTSYWPMLWPATENAELTLDLSKATLSIPKLPMDARPWRYFGKPDGDADTSWRTLVSGEFSREIIRDIASRTTTLKIDDRSDVDVSIDHGLSHWSVTERLYHITDGDPCSARLDITRQLGIKRDGTSAETQVSASISTSKTYYEWKMDLSATVNGKRFVSRTFEGKTRRAF